MSRLRSNKVVNQAGTGAPELTYGAVVPGTGTISGAGKVSIGGSITAGSFHGDGSGLSGVGDPSALKDGNNVKVQAISTGANVTGNLGVSGDATVTGNLTVNGTTTTIDTAVTSVDSLAVDGDITAGGKVKVGDDDGSKSKSVKLGDDDDLTLYYDGRGGYVTSYIESDQMIIRPKTTPSDSYIDMLHGGSVRLYHGSSTRLSTSATGVGISGELSVSGNTTLTGTGSLKVPVGTTAQRPTPAAGMFRYNSTEGKFEGYTTEWGEIGGGGGGLTTAAHVANNAVVTLDLTAAIDHKVTATGICTITCTGGTEAQSHTIRIINSGSATVGFSTYFLFPSGNAPVLPSGDGAINLVSFTVNRVGAAGTQLLAGASLNFS